MLLIGVVLIPLLAAVLGLVTPSRAWWERLNLVAFALVAALAIQIAREVGAQGPLSALGGMLRADSLSALVLLLTALVALVCAVYAVSHLRRDQREGRITQGQLRRYYVLTPLFVSAMLLAPVADNLGVMWVAIESATLASVLLVTFYNQKTSFEAGWKYIIIGSVGVSLALSGTVFLYSSAAGVLGSGAHGGLNWSVLVTVAERLDPEAMRLAFILVLLGYGTKAGLVPLHTWKPDAYAEAPVPTAALLGAGFINCALYAIMRVEVLAARCVGQEFAGRLMVGFGVASILVAAPFVLVQRNFRRLLAYSSIDHAGIIVAGLGFGGKLGALGAVLHLLFHALTKPLLFFCAGDVQQHYATPYLWKVRGVLRVLPCTGTMFLVATLAVSGTPPFSLFQSEFTILSAALVGDHGWAAGLFTAGVVTIFAGFLRHMSRMNLGTRPAGVSVGEPCPWKLAAMLPLATVIVVLGVWLPAPLFELARQSAQIIAATP